MTRETVSHRHSVNEQPPPFEEISGFLADQTSRIFRVRSRQDSRTSQDQLPSYGDIYPRGLSERSPRYEDLNEPRERRGRFLQREVSRAYFQGDAEGTKRKASCSPGMFHGAPFASANPVTDNYIIATLFRSGRRSQKPGRRMIPHDHPYYDMSPQERSRLQKLGIDPVIAAEMKSMGRSRCPRS